MHSSGLYPSPARSERCFETSFSAADFTHKVDHVNLFRHVFRDISPVPAWMMLRHRAVFILFPQYRLDVCYLFPRVIIFLVDIFKMQNEIIFKVARAALPVNSKTLTELPPKISFHLRSPMSVVYKLARICRPWACESFEGAWKSLILFIRAFKCSDRGKKISLAPKKI